MSVLNKEINKLAEIEEELRTVCDKIIRAEKDKEIALNLATETQHSIR